MKQFLCILVLIVVSTLTAFAQDTIQGMYEYTYGDSESLVDAKQTCKNLAIRDALESYYLFVESTTEVENFQLKEDLIQSITLGSVRDIKVIDETVEGRLISMTITAIVDPDEIKLLVEKQIAEKPAEESVSQESHSDQDVSLVTALNQYEIEFKNIEQTISQQDPKKLVILLQTVDQYLIKHRPNTNDKFTKTLYASVVVRNKLLGDLAKLKLYQKERNKLQAMNQRKVIHSQSDRLRKTVAALKAFTNLGPKKKAVQKRWVTRCEQTLDLVNEQKRVLKKKRR